VRRDLGVARDVDVAEPETEIGAAGDARGIAAGDRIRRAPEGLASRDEGVQVVVTKGGVGSNDGGEVAGRERNGAA